MHELISQTTNKHLFQKQKYSTPDLQIPKAQHTGSVTQKSKSSIKAKTKIPENGKNKNGYPIKHSKRKGLWTINEKQMSSTQHTHQISCENRDYAILFNLFL